MPDPRRPRRPPQPPPLSPGLSAIPGIREVVEPTAAAASQAAQPKPARTGGQGRGPEAGRDPEGAAGGRLRAEVQGIPGRPSVPSTDRPTTTTMWPPPLSETPQEFEVKPRTDGKRIDAYLASRFTDYSRRVIQKVIDAEAVLVNGRPVKASYRVRAGDRVSVRLPELPDMTPEPEDIPIEVVYEDAALTVVNKPPGMVTHPAKGNWRGTLVNAIQFHYDTLSTLAGENRPGIVHRLDRDTTGLLVVAQGRPGPPPAGAPVRAAAGPQGIPGAGARASRSATAITSSGRSASTRPSARRWRSATPRGRWQGRGDVLRGRRAVPRLRAGAVQAADRPHPPDPHPPHPHRPPDPGRQALLGAGSDHAWLTSPAPIGSAPVAGRGRDGPDRPPGAARPPAAVPCTP